MSNVCSSWQQEHQTNDVIAQSGKCHVTSLALVVAEEGKRENLWPAHERQTGTDNMNARRQWRRQLAWTSFVQMHVMWLWY